MDTKTPPIPLKVQEKPQQPKKQERVVAGVSLPPLTPYPNHHRQKQKPPPGTPWSRDAPCTVRYQDHQKRRPYRVLHIGATPLMHACQQADRARVLRLLKEQEGTVGYRDRTLRNTLHYCMDAGTAGAVASAAPELVNAPDAEGHTPLHLAVIAGDTQLVAVLLANGADVNAKDLEGHSVLHWATVCGEAECVRLVLAAGARPSTPDLRGGSPLHYAAQCCGAAATAELAVPKKVGLKVLQTLLEFGADVNAKDEDGRQPILWAASAGSVEAVLALARAGGSATAGASDKDGLTALHCAASRGHARCIEALVNLCGSQPDHVDDNGCSALHYAATLGHADATALILKLGADPNRQDRKGRTPALCAAAKGQLETLKILAQHGGSLHARTVRGTGVAHEAVASGRIELIKWLAKKRPSTLDVATQDGKTPLHVAALHGHLDACKVLLDHGARINAVLRTSKGNLMTALDAALYRGHRDCAKLIQMHGGTTAQQLRSQKTASNKVFAAKLRVRHTESSTETDSSPRRRGRGHRHPDLYYEERWIERKTRRKGSLRKLARRDSRSFSEEEVRLSKTSKGDRQRRARSESSRYEKGDSADRGTRRKPSKRRSTRYKHDYSGSSLESESCENSQDDENDTTRTILRRRVEKRRRRSKDEKQDAVSNGNGNSKSRQDDDETSVSDDSLEVVVVKRSLEKTCEKVVSGRRSKTPKESSKETKLVRTHRRSSRRKSKSRSRTSENGDATEAQSSEKARDSKADATPVDETPRASMEEKSENNIIESRYRRDVTDSTSQETVERVVVTAIVHKDQPPDTPKSTLETKEVTFEDRKETIEKEETREVKEYDSIVERGEDTHGSIISKAADLKRDVEQMKRQGSQDKERGNEVESDKSTEKDVIEEGRLDARENEREEDRELKKRRESTEEEERRSFTVISFTGSSQEKQSSEKQVEETAETSAEAETTERSLENGATEKIQGIAEDRKIGKKRDSKSSSDERKSRSPSPRKIGGERRKEETGRRTTPRKSVSVKTSSGEGTKSDKGETTEESQNRSRRSSDGESSGVREEKDSEAPGKDTLSLPREKFRKESSDEQADSARGKSMDLSSDSRDSALMEEEGDEFPTNGLVAMKEDVQQEYLSPRKSDGDETMQRDDFKKGRREESEGKEDFRYIDESSSSSPRSSKPKRQSRPSTGKLRKSRRSSSRSPTKRSLFESSEERSPDQSAIVAVIESPEWDDEDEEVEKEIRDVIGEDAEHETEPEDNGIGVMRVLPSTSEEETPRIGLGLSRTSGIDSLPQVQPTARSHITRIQSPQDSKSRLHVKQRRDSGGRDSGIEPSPRVSRIPKRKSTRCCPITDKQRALNIDTITRDVQISLRRYHLERKIFFQLMELKRLQIRHGRANEQVLVKRQVDAFHKAGMSGPTLGVAKYDQPLTFRHFEAFLYEQLRKLQRRSATPDFCTEARQCTQKTHRCHHATSAYTSTPVYTYLGGSVPERERADLLPKIESRGKGQMTVEVTHGEEKQVIALPAERLDRTKRYFVTFTVRGESQETEKPKSSGHSQRNAKSV